MDNKAAVEPILGSFYIVDGQIYYSEKGIDHSDLWKKIVLKTFPNLDYDTKMELVNAPYGIDRGRVDWYGDFDSEGKPMGKGKYILFGTPGCKQHESELKRIFYLDKLPKSKFEANFTNSDGHYVTKPNDLDVYKDVLKFTAPKHIENKHIAKRLKDTIRAIIAKKIK